MQCAERWVCDRLRADLFWRAGDELDDTWGYTGFFEDLVDDVVGVGRSGRGLPDADVSDEGGGYMIRLDSERCELKRNELATRFPPMAVKLKGETAKTKPSSARYSRRL